MRAWILVAVGSLLAASTGSSARAGFPADRSEDVAWYVARGAPSPDRTWGPADYERFASALMELLRSDPLRLPRLRSERSGPLFRRAVDVANLEVIRSTPAEVRLPVVMEYNEGAKKLLKIYLARMASGWTFDDEIAGLVGFLLPVLHRSVLEGRHFLSTLPADDPNRAVRERGYAKLKSALASGVAATIQMIGERDTYRNPARLRLVGDLQRYLPTLFSELTATQRQEVLVDLDELERSEKDRAIRQRIRELQATIRSA